MTDTRTPIEAAARPPSSWERQTVAVLVAVAASGALGVLLLATQVGLSAYLLGDGTTAASALIVWMVGHAVTVDVLHLVPALAYIGAFRWWRHQTRTTLRRVGDVVGAETVDSYARRWLLIPPGGDVDSVRGSVPAGAVVTVFPAPPAAGETDDWTPPAAEAYHGFLEDAASGALWYQSVSPKRVPAFLARARSARRWALYPTDAPDALTALVPAPAAR